MNTDKQPVENSFQSEDEADRWSQKKSTFSFFSLGTGVFVISLLLIVCVVFLKAKKAQPAKEDEKISPQKKIEEENSALLIKREIEEKKSAVLIKTQIETTVNAYLSASNIAEKIKWSRLPERVRPMMDAYYKTHSFAPTELGTIHASSALSIWHQPFVLVEAVTKDKKRHNLLLKQIDAKSFLVDWEVDVHYQPVLWEGFLAKRLTSAQEMRVRIRPDNYYNHQFSDDSRYECFHISCRGSDKTAYAYVEKNSKIWNDLRIFFKNRKKTHSDGEPAILRLQFPENVEKINPPQILIDKFIFDGWVFVQRDLK